MTVWLDNLRQRRNAVEPACLVTVMDVRGSAPREPGAKMQVTAIDLTGSIGGGQLEYLCTRVACEPLGSTQAVTPPPTVRTFTLGANCGQCCGGVVDVLFEWLPEQNSAWVDDLLRYYEARIPVVIATAVDPLAGYCKFLITADEASSYAAAPEMLGPVAVAGRQALARSAPAARLRIESPIESPTEAQASASLNVLLEPVLSSPFHLAVFGAGHVGSAVVGTVANLECNVRWVDGRRDVFPAECPPGITRIECDRPEREVEALPEGAFYLVMTHSHALDFEICERILRRGDFAYLGLIGSISKRRRFERLMRKQGMAPSLLERLTCPIGIAGIGGKRPQEIAIAVAAEILQRKERLSGAAGGRREPHKNVHRLRR